MQCYFEDSLAKWLNQNKGKNISGIQLYQVFREGNAKINNITVKTTDVDFICKYTVTIAKAHVIVNNNLFCLEFDVKGIAVKSENDEYQIKVGKNISWNRLLKTTNQFIEKYSRELTKRLEDELEIISEGLNRARINAEKAQSRILVAKF